MSHGPSLIFDKSALESLSLDEAVLLDNFYRSSITPLFFVECLADLEKAIRSKSTPEQLVGSLARRTPDSQSCTTAHHQNVLGNELARKFDLSQVLERPLIPYGQPVQLGDKKGIVFRRSPEEEALQRWTQHEFLEVERGFAKRWRNSLMRTNHDDLVKTVMTGIGHWRKPKSLEDAKAMADYIIDNMDQEWLIGFGLQLFDLPEATQFVRDDWTARRKPPIRQYLPYLTFMLSVNIFFTLIIQTQLLRNIKQSHQIDLAYLYYLPFCSVFTSKDRFHVQIVPLFMNERQTFVNGEEMKQDLARLVELYSSMPDEVLTTGLFTFAQTPPEDTSYLVTRLWDRYLPLWRGIKEKPREPHNPEADRRIIEEIGRWVDGGPDIQPHDEHDIEKLDHVTISRSVMARKGRWRRFSEEQEERMRDEKQK